MIRIAGLTKTFRRHVVLDAVTLAIGAGDRIALIGANGAGKTTLIRCLLGEYTHDGEIDFDGLAPRRDRCAVLQGLGFVPQLPPPLKMPVGDLLRFSAAVSDTSASRIADVLTRLGLALDDVRHKPFVKLSGGQKQKILAAIALGRDSRFLILDEPTANLDPVARKVMFEMLAEAPDRPMLISSHRLEEVVGLVNRVVELDRGRIVLDERIAASGALSARHPCRIAIERADDGLFATLQQWQFTPADNSRRIWNGVVAGADRLRFLAALTRYGGLIASLRLDGEESVSRLAANSPKSGEGSHALDDCA